MSEKRLSSGFQSVFGDTIYSYYRKQVLKKANELLLLTNKPVNEIAYDCGYSSPSNFGAAFKRMYGVSPHKYRENSILK